MVNMHDNGNCLATNKCVLTKQHSTLMGNKWLSNAFSRFTSSVLGKSNEGKVDNTNVDSNPNFRSNSKPDFNFFLEYNIVFIFQKWSSRLRSLQR